MRSRRLLARTGLGPWAVLLGLLGTPLPSWAVTFSYTGGQQTWVVPAGVTSINVDAMGAFTDLDNSGGGRVQTTLAVTPGETLTIVVGGRNPSNGPTGGYNGGGNGTSYGGAGATDIRQGGSALANRVIVAGGGGGRGAFAGGNGGGTTGAAGGGPTPGLGGTPSAGGAAGGNGGAGSLGQGGNGGVGGTYNGGGGGGGYYGGGGGDGTTESGGGGGSSYAGPGTSATTHTQGYNHTGDGQVIITYTVSPTNVQFTFIASNTLVASWTLDSPGSETPLVVLSTMSNFSVTLSSAAGTLGLQTTTYYPIADNTTYYFKVKLTTASDAGYSAAISTLNAAAMPATIVFDEISTKAITASAYAATPAFSNQSKGQSGINVAIGGAYGGWRSGDAWTTKAVMLTARYGLAAAVVGGKVYAVGGNNGGAIAVNEEYDPAANSWTTRAAMPTARQFPGAAVVGGKVYIGGGVGGTTANEEYDPAANSWTIRAAMPTGRSEFGAAAVGGKVYAVGGVGVAYDINEEYDPAVNSWTTRAAMPTARYYLAAAAVGGKVYAVGGNNAGGLAVNEEYDPVANNWTTKVPMPTARWYFAAAVVGGKVYAVGGDSGPLTVNEEYDPAANRWTTRVPMPTARKLLAAAAAGGKVYAVGGVGPLNVNEEYDPGFSRAFAGLLPNTQYSFKAQARNSIGMLGGESPTVSTYTLAAASTSVSGTTFALVDWNLITVQWSSGSAAGGFNGPGAQYKVEASTRADFIPIWSTAQTGNLSADVSGLSPLTTYYFRVKPINVLGVANDPFVLGSTKTLILLPPTTPALAFPPDSRLTSDRAPSFSWGAAGSTYTLQISSFTNFSAFALDKTGLAATFYVLLSSESLSRGTTYYWRVYAHNLLGTSSPSASRALYVAHANTAYSLEASTDALFGYAVLSQDVVSHDPMTLSTNTLAILSDASALAQGRTWYWRVRTMNAGGVLGAWASPLKSFTVPVFVGTPSPGPPADGATVSTTTPLLAWSSAAGATSYRLEVSSSSDFVALMISSSGITGTSYQVVGGDGLLDHTSYYWRVTAANGAQTAASSIRRFLADTSIPAALAPLFPENGRLSSNRRPSFDWSAATDPLGRTITYNLEVSTNSGFVPLRFSQANISASSYTLTGVGPQLLDRGATYYWRVTATNQSTGLSTTTASQFFMVRSNTMTYTLEAADNVAFSPLYYSSSTTSLDPLAPSTTTLKIVSDNDALQNGTTYYWRVRARDSGGLTGPNSTPVKLVYVNTTIGTPVLSSPANLANISTTTPLLSWSSSPGASSYRLEASSLTTFAPLAISSSGISGTSYQVTAGNGLADHTTYYWRVAATDGASTAISAVSQFVVDVVIVNMTVPTLPAPAFPENGRFSAHRRPSFSWSAATDPLGRAIAYTLEVSTKSSFVPLRFSQANIPVSSYTLTGLGPQLLDRGATYYWRVTAVNSATGVSTTTVPQSFMVRSNTMTYTLEVADNVAFSPLYYSSSTTSLDPLALSTTTLKIVSDNDALQNGTAYYWRVRAQDSGGLTGPNAAPVKNVYVNTPIGAPALTAPENVATITTTTPLMSWSSVPGALSYKLEVSSLSTFSPLRISSPTMTSTSYQVLAGDGLADHTTYYWRVAATDGVSTVASPVSRFLIDIPPPADMTVPTLPALLFPENGRLSSNRRPSFDWSAATGPVTYALEVSTNSGFVPLRFSQANISASSYTLTGVGPQLLDRGATYYWRVTATNQSTGLSTTTASQFFMVRINTATYTLEVSSETSFASIYFTSSTISLDSMQYATTTITMDINLLNATTYYWRLRARDSNGLTGLFSSPLKSVLIDLAAGACTPPASGDWSIPTGVTCTISGNTIVILPGSLVVQCDAALVITGAGSRLKFRNPGSFIRIKGQSGPCVAGGTIRQANGGAIGSP